MNIISSAEGARAAVVGPICLAAKPLVRNKAEVRSAPAEILAIMSNRI